MLYMENVALSFITFNIKCHSAIIQLYSLYVLVIININIIVSNWYLIPHTYITQVYTSTIFSSLVNLDVIFCDELLETVVLSGITGRITGLLVDWGLSGRSTNIWKLAFFPKQWSSEQL